MHERESHPGGDALASAAAQALRERAEAVRRMRKVQRKRLEREGY
mgnify:CR=1 FL=1